MHYELEEYIKMMESKGYKQWQIGWESTPKYIGHKIYNTRTKLVGILEWVEYHGPEIKDEDGNLIPFCANEFKHGTGEWIYKIGENYETI